MRLHHLTVTAFGPFADTVEVDFDALASGGLFLLTGATGAGKTSVLDAVCFGLYGQVPGERSHAKHLRSDHAPADREPRVVLELSIGERRLRFTRSPAWTRPKRRGTGTTTVPAHVLVEERRDGTWTGLTNRLDEAGLLVTDLLGMTCTQFTQVALLPQGRFQAFLRASSAERHDVLQRLFRTDRFERVERWLVDKRTEARRAMEASESGTVHVLTRIEEAGACDLPAELRADLASAADEGLLEAWARERVQAAALDRVAADAALRATTEAVDQATSRLAAARDLQENATRAQAAEARLAELDRTAAAADLGRDRLSAHRRASPLADLADQTTRAALDADRADQAVAALRARWADPSVPGADGEGLAELRATWEQTQLAVAAATAFLPRESELHALELETARLQEAMATTEALLAEQRAAQATLPARLAAAAEARAIAQDARARLDGAGDRTALLRAQAGDAIRLAEVGRALDTARNELREATSVAQQLREVYLDVREQRINGMAAELAGALASGCSCPVCGSAQHPAPARPTAAAVGRTDEDLARRAHEDAAFVEQGVQVLVAGLESEHTTLATRLDGVDLGSLNSQLSEASAAETTLRATAEVLPAAEAACVELDTVAARLQDDLSGSALALERLTAELAAAGDRMELLSRERDALLDGEAASVADLLRARTDRLELIGELLAALQQADSAGSRAADLADGLQRAASAGGFDSPAAVLDAVLGEDEAEAIGLRLAERERERTLAEQILAEPGARAAAGEDLTTLSKQVEDLAAHLEETSALAGVRATEAAAAHTRHERLGALGSDLLTALNAWAPLRRKHRTVADLASLAEGRSADNPWRMRLAAYVLAERLRQVVAAANERLHAMTEGRFSLEHVLDRGVGEQRGGLSLRVRDDWNGVERDPATLSGGETFVVSLALALGLADTVAHEAGGTDIDTLFIDEGFGSLDADTLEDVMDTLDSLRDGGRVVGLVSHVPELRSRITTQLEVAKGRTGSTLRPVLVNG